MESNTVQTLIDYVKDISGQDNASDAKIVRALNFGADKYSRIAITSSGKWRWDSSNQTDMPRITTTVGSSDTKVSLPTELIAIELVEILEDGDYQLVQPIDIRDNDSESLSAVYDSAGLTRYYDYDSAHLYLYPVSDSSRTLRVTYSRAHPRFSTSNLTQNVGVVPIDEEFLAFFAADRIMLGMNDPARTQVRQELQMMEADIRDMFSKRDQDTSRRLKGKTPDVFMRRSRGNR
jgi:hypothetical protein